MSINWAALKSKKTTPAALFGILFGPSGAGKSSALGTLGVRTLVLHGVVESHAATNAKTRASNPELVTGVDYSVLKEDGTLDANKSFRNLLDILRDPEIAKEFDAVCLDSSTELQQIIGQTAQFIEGCLSDKGKHNKFAEGDVYTKMLGEVVSLLLVLHKRGVHVLVTCAALTSTQSEDGLTVSAKPSMAGFSVGENFVRNFSDVFYLSLTKDEEGKPVHKFLFQPSLGMVSKDLKGVVQKMSFANFTPRLSYFLRDELPDVADVDLAKIIKAREAKA